jgi:CRP-like cAMP-binding protein
MSQLSKDTFPKTAVFDALPVDFLESLAPLGRTLHFTPGEVLVEQGEPNEWLHIITRGQVCVESAHPASGSAISCEKLGPGEIVGEQGILDHTLPTSTARADGAVETFRFQHSAIAWALLGVPEAIPAFATALEGWKEASRQLRRSSSCEKARYGPGPDSQQLLPRKPR